MILKQVIKYSNANALEATWIDDNGYNIKCRSYDNMQMDELRIDLGADVADYEAMIAEIEAAIPTDAEFQAVLDGVVF